MFYDVLADRLELPREARELFNAVQAKAGDLPELQNALFSNEVTTEQLTERVEAAAEKLGIHMYTFCFYFLFKAAKRLHGCYIEKGIGEDVFFNTMNDLKYKLAECHAVHGIWGTFVFGWFREFYLMTRFALGRLQYDIYNYFWEPYEKHGISVQKGDVVYNCHIPSAGPLTKELCQDSYQKAYDFFGRHPLVIICDSWILYPPQRDFLPPGSRILDFMDDFDIINSHDHAEGFPDAWRVFGKDHVLPPEQWPVETGLQRAYAERIKQGKPVGTGQGVIVFDGEKIINRTAR
jgi:hypothetical protein